MEVAIVGRGILIGHVLRCIVLFWKGVHFILGGGGRRSWPATPPHGEQRSRDQLQPCTRSKVTDTVL